MSNRSLMTTTREPVSAADDVFRRIAALPAAVAFEGMLLRHDNFHWAFERLLARTEERDGCWFWTGYLRSGYPTISVRNRLVGGHRLALVLKLGIQPLGMVARHTCDVTPCWRFDHLLAGTQADNVADMLSRGRHPGPPHHKGDRNNRATLTSVKIAAIRDAVGTTRAVADRFGVSQSTVWRIRHRLERS